jgi:predicted Zn-dependent protease
MKRIINRLAILASAALLAGCSGNGGGGGGGLGNISIGGIGIPGVGGGGGGGNRVSQYVNMGSGVIEAYSANSLNEADEDEMGRTVAIAATNQWPLYDNPNLTKYVTMVGLAVADSSSRPGGNWVFGVLDTPQIGAYSGPNGYILITRGAISAMQDEAELAGVIAHEISHVVNRDGFNAVKNSKVMAGIAKAGTATLQGNQEIFKQLADVAVDKVLKTGWSRDQEVAADDGAVQLLIASGYDPGGLPRFLGRMQQQQGNAGGAFSTHPGTGDRIARTTSQSGGKTGATNRERFAKAKAEAKL